MSNGSPHLWLRAETRSFEGRTPLTPTTAKMLLEAGFNMTVERSEQRIFDDEDYSEIGCSLVDKLSWKTDAPDDAYIVGLKSLPETDQSPLNHNHIYFGHCYKYQQGWKELLGRFDSGKGTLLDIEFLKDDQNQRVAAFGYMAGYSGSAIAIDIWCHQKLNKEYGSISPYPNEEALIAHTKDCLSNAVSSNGNIFPRVFVIGAHGRCGTGACDFARRVGIPEENIIQWDINETKKGGPFPEILQADIFICCVYISQKISPFITRELIDQTEDRQLSVICDVSCENTSSNNPIPIYSTNTTFDKPTMSIETSGSCSLPLEVCAIDYLPSFLPRESSVMFSDDLLPIILALKNRHRSSVWNRAEDMFKEKMEESKTY